MKIFFTGVCFFFSFLIAAQNPDSVLVNKNAACIFFESKGIKLDTLKDQYLYYKIYDWIGTKYKYAGESKTGIDCSGFVTEMYKEVYCKQLSGGSGDIYKEVKPVDKDKLSEGDLVFFKIKKGHVSHVGIYLVKNKFAHASVHNGVVISDLDEPYYKKYYYSGGKLIAD